MTWVLSLRQVGGSVASVQCANRLLGIVTGFFPDHRVEHLIIEVVGSDVSLRSDVDPSVEFPDGHAAVDLSHVGGTVEEHPGVPGLCSFQSFLSAAVGTDDASKFRIAGLVVLTRSGIALSAHPFKERSSSASDSVKPRKSNRLLISLASIVIAFAII